MTDINFGTEEALKLLLLTNLDYLHRIKRVAHYRCPKPDGEIYLFIDIAVLYTYTDNNNGYPELGYSKRII